MSAYDQIHLDYLHAWEQAEAKLKAEAKTLAQKHIKKGSTPTPALEPTDQEDISVSKQVLACLETLAYGGKRRWWQKLLPKTLPNFLDNWLYGKERVVYRQYTRQLCEEVKKKGKLNHDHNVLLLRIHGLTIEAPNIGLSDRDIPRDPLVTDPKGYLLGFFKFIALQFHKKKVVTDEYTIEVLKAIETTTQTAEKTKPIEALNLTFTFPEQDVEAVFRNALEERAQRNSQYLRPTESTSDTDTLFRATKHLIERMRSIRRKAAKKESAEAALPPIQPLATLLPTIGASDPPLAVVLSENSSLSQDPAPPHESPSLVPSNTVDLPSENHTFLTVVPLAAHLSEDSEENSSASDTEEERVKASSPPPQQETKSSSALLSTQIALPLTDTALIGIQVPQYSLIPNTILPCKKNLLDLEVEIRTSSQKTEVQKNKSYHATFFRITKEFLDSPLAEFEKLKMNQQAVMLYYGRELLRLTQRYLSSFKKQPPESLAQRGNMIAHLEKCTRSYSATKTKHEQQKLAEKRARLEALKAKKEAEQKRIEELEAFARKKGRTDLVDHKGDSLEEERLTPAIKTAQVFSTQKQAGKSQSADTAPHQKQRKGFPLPWKKARSQPVGASETHTASVS